MTADPKKVRRAFSVDIASYEEAMELSHFGAKIIYSPTIQPVMKSRIPVRIKNTFKPEHPGTLIQKKTGSGNGGIKGISSIDDIALVTLKGSGLVRSEEHTSELQSRGHLVCRLLLENNKHRIT